MTGMPDLAHELRTAMRRFATTVAIITTGRDTNPVGMAATAVMSVTTDPPTILVAISREASLSPVMARETQFCVICSGSGTASWWVSSADRKKGA